MDSLALYTAKEFSAKPSQELGVLKKRGLLMFLVSSTSSRQLFPISQQIKRISASGWIGLLLLLLMSPMAQAISTTPVFLWQLAGTDSGYIYSTPEEPLAILNAQQSNAFSICMNRVPPKSCSLRTAMAPYVDPATSSLLGVVINGQSTHLSADVSTYSYSNDGFGHVSELTTVQQALGILGNPMCPSTLNYYAVSTLLSTAKNYSMVCTKIETPPKQCATGMCCNNGSPPNIGNPIQSHDGSKIEAIVDYSTADGLLSVERKFLGQKIGWRMAGSLGIVDLFSKKTTGSEIKETFYGIERDVNGVQRTISNTVNFPYTSTRVLGEVYFINPDGTHAIFMATAGGAFQLDASGNSLEKLAVPTPEGAVWRIIRTDNTIEDYGVDGHLIKRTMLGGSFVLYQYSSNRKLSLMQDNFGRTLVYSYRNDGLLDRVTLPDGLFITYNYQGGILDSVTNADGTIRRYLYNEPGFISQAGAAQYSLTGVIDENGARFGTYQYDSLKRATSTESAGGANKYTLYYGNGFTSVTPPLGASYSYYFAQVAGATVVTRTNQPGGSGCGASASNMTYDTNGNIATRTDYNGNKTAYTYNLTRNLETSRTEGLTTAGAKTSATRTTTTTWHPTYRLPQTITEQDTSTATAVTLRVTTLGYDASGNLTSRTMNDPVANVSRSWTYTYNTAGQILTADGPRTDVTDLTTYTYDTQGNLATVTNALNQTNTLSNYNAHGQPGTITDANGLVTALVYDTRQRLITRTTGFGSATPQTTTYNYDGVGQLTSVITPSGATYTYTYDAAHRLTDITDGIGNHIHYTLDVMNNRTQEQIFDAANNVVQSHSRTFDALNRLYQDIGAVNQTTTYAYDANGNLTRVTDPLNRQTNQTYDALNRLITSTDAANGLSRYGYDAIDQLVKVTDPNNLITQYQRNGLGNLNVQISPDTGTTINSYDAAGNLKLRADAKGQQANYSYDALNRVTGITYTGLPAQSISYQYDQGTNGIGRLTNITDVTGTTTYSYDTFGHLISDTKQLHGATYTTSYAYDTQGRLASITYPSGRVVSYSFDAMGRINQISTTANTVTRILASNIVYEPFGGVHSFTFGDGLTTPVQSYVRQRDADGRIASYTLNGKVINIGYNTASELLSLTDPTQPILVANYGYDPMSRLNSYIQGSIAQGYSYDADGNRTSQTLGVGTSNYTYAAGSNRLASIQSGSGTTNLTQDANGATTNDTTRQYSYDARGRLVRATTVADIINYEVNALGLRVRKQVPYNNTDTIYHYDAQGHLIAESPTGSTGFTREYIYLGDQPVAVMQ